jgi:hypothetical protein
LLGMPPLQLNSSVRVELRNSDGSFCFGADHDTVVKDTPSQFKAKGDDMP